MISRVADHCFWVGRYIERAESTARLLQVTRALAFDAELPPLHCWRPLMIVSGQFPEFSGHFGAEAAGNGDIVQRYMTWAPENPVSIRTSVRAAREGARSIRRGSRRRSAAIQVGQVESSMRCCAMYLRGSATMRARNSSRSAALACGPISMP